MKIVVCEEWDEVKLEVLETEDIQTECRIVETDDKAVPGLKPGETMFDSSSGHTIFVHFPVSGKYDETEMTLSLIPDDSRIFPIAAMAE